MDIASAWFVDRVRRSKKRKRQAKAGWFYDPRSEAPYRFWDGARWTEHTADERPTN